MTPDSGSILPSRLRTRDLLAQSALCLTRQPARSILTLSGIALAAFAFVATLGITSTLGRQVSAEFDALRATEVVIRPTERAQADPLTAAGVARIGALNGVVQAGRVVTGPTVRLSRGWATSLPTTTARLIAAEPGGLGVIDPEVSVGRLYDQFHEDAGARVVLLSRPIAEQLGISTPGGSVFVESVAFTVIGIFDDVGRESATLQGVVVPYAVGMEMMAGRAVETAEVLVEVEPGAAQLIGQQAPLALAPEAPDTLESLAPPDPKLLRREVEPAVTRSGYILSLCAFLVGLVSIGVSAWTNVLNRRTELGLRRAVGARGLHIFGQLVVETGLLGTVGGIVGALAGTMLVIAVAVGKAWLPVVDIRLALIASLGGALAGILAGLIPAVRAARITPLEALRR